MRAGSAGSRPVTRSQRVSTWSPFSSGRGTASGGRRCSARSVQYSGFPRALNAIRVVTDTLIENGAEIPEPLGPDA